MANQETMTSTDISAEITVSTDGGGVSTSMTPTQFIEYLKAMGSKDNPG